MTFNFDILLLIVAIFVVFSGLYFGFFNQLRRTLSSAAGLVVSIYVSEIVVNILSSMGNLKNIIGKIVNIFFRLDYDVALKLVVGLIIFLLVKLFVFLFIGIFKRRDTKSFIKDKTIASSLIGGVLGLVDAYIIGLLLYLLFLASGGVSDANISNTIFNLLPQIKQIIEQMSIIPIS